MTLNDLKKITGYSVSTLSKAFNGSDEIPENTRNKIFIAAEKHGVLNKYAKKTCKKKIIAAIVPEFISEAYASFIALLDRAAEKYGAILTVAQDNFSTDKKRELIEFYSDYGGADGIIAFDVSFSHQKGHGNSACLNRLGKRSVFGLRILRRRGGNYGGFALS